MISKFKGQHIVITKELVLTSYFDKKTIDRWEIFYENNLNTKFSQGEYININGEELCVLRVINNLDGSVEYKVDKILSIRRY